MVFSLGAVLFFARTGIMTRKQGFILLATFLGFLAVQLLI